jgi:hypothetical protein
MPGLVPGIHVFLYSKEGVNGRDKPGHDVEKNLKPPSASDRLRTIRPPAIFP